MRDGPVSGGDQTPHPGAGPLRPPVFGRLTGGRGDFHGDDTWSGRPIRAHFVWSGITAGAARRERRFTLDGGHPEVSGRRRIVFRRRRTILRYGHACSSVADNARPNRSRWNTTVARVLSHPRPSRRLGPPIRAVRPEVPRPAQTVRGDRQAPGRRVGASSRWRSAPARYAGTCTNAVGPHPEPVARRDRQRPVSPSSASTRDTSAPVRTRPHAAEAVTDARYGLLDFVDASTSTPRHNVNAGLTYKVPLCVDPPEWCSLA
ncbi:hypothetical protein Aph02nite_31640 [Actinoplanes philippinensis]|nr:hypothetical protein Aph02nite_31640 [Actinoplanes philippinensis]